MYYHLTYTPVVRQIWKRRSPHGEPRRPARGRGRAAHRVRTSVPGLGLGHVLLHVLVDVLVGAMRAPPAPLDPAVVNFVPFPEPISRFGR